jgi:hypothetical protein
LFLLHLDFYLSYQSYILKGFHPSRDFTSDSELWVQDICSRVICIFVLIIYIFLVNSKEMIENIKKELMDDIIIEPEARYIYEKTWMLRNSYKIIQTKKQESRS